MINWIELQLKQISSLHSALLMYYWRTVDRVHVDEGKWQEEKETADF